jgi:hypothetical protein
MPILIFDNETLAQTAQAEVKIFVKYSTQLGPADNWPDMEEYESLYYVAAPDLGFNSEGMGHISQTAKMPSVAMQVAIEKQLSSAKYVGGTIYDGFVKQLLVGGVNASTQAGEFWIHATPLALALKEGFLDIALSVIAEYEKTLEADRPGNTILSDELLGQLTLMIQASKTSS